MDSAGLSLREHLERLECACKELESSIADFPSLDADERKRNLLVQAVLRFVDALESFPGGSDELVDRRNFMHSGRPGGDRYLQSRPLWTFGPNWPVDTANLSPDAVAAIESLAQLSDRCGSASDLQHVEALITSAISSLASDFGSTPVEEKLRLDLVGWRTVCRELLHTLESWGENGCLHLWGIQKSFSLDPHCVSDKVVWPYRGIITTASRSLLDWAKHQLNGPNLTHKPVVAGLPTPEGSSPTPAKSAKKSTQKGDGQAKLIAALLRYHEYDNGSSLNQKPVGSNLLARLADVDKSTASLFFKRQFKGYPKYRAMCGTSALLIASLKMLNGDFAPHVLLSDGGASLEAHAD